MATKITINGYEDSTERRVQEDPVIVSGKVNAALQENHKFLILTDADTGKEFSVEPDKLGSIDAE